MKFYWLLSFGFLLSCAHPMPHGTIAMKISDEVGHAALHDVSRGDKVALMMNECEQGVSPTGGEDRCKEKTLAEGVVSRVINNHYSEVRFPAGTKLAEGQMIEVIK
jgi:hypothetical protein